MPDRTVSRQDTGWKSDDSLVQGLEVHVGTATCAVRRALNSLIMVRDISVNGTIETKSSCTYAQS